VLDLKSFRGDVFIANNVFSFNIAKYKDCSSAYDTLSDTHSLGDPYPSYGSTKDKVQIKSVVSVTDHHHAFTLIDNTFERNTGTKGVVYLDLFDRTNHPLIISGNTFTSNGGYVDASVLHIRVRAKSTLTPGTTAPDSPANFFCSNIDISSNTFTGNYGCGQAVGAVVRFQCIGYADPATGNYD